MNWIPLFLLALACLILIPTGSGNVIKVGDSEFPSDPAAFLEEKWKNHSYQLIYPFYLAVLNGIGLPSWAVQRVFFITIFFLLGFGGYLLISELTGNRNAGLAAGVLLMFNPIYFDVFYGGAPQLLFSLSALPFIASLILIGIEEKDNLCFALAGLLSMVSATHPAGFLLSLAVCFLLLFYLIFVKKVFFPEAVSYFFIFTAVVIISNLYWLLWLPEMAAAAPQYQGLTNPILKNATWLSFPMLFTLMPYSANDYLSFAVVFVLSAIGFYFAFWHKETRFFALLFPAAVWFMLFISANPWFYEIPGSIILRDPAKLLLLSPLCYAVFLGVGLDYIMRKAEEKGIALPFITVIFILAFSFRYLFALKVV